LLIATWNVNSIRTRLSQITDWINKTNPDILCLQETKVIDDGFPIEPFEKLGYSVEVYGQKSYNGVAIISKLKPENVKKGFYGCTDFNQNIEIIGLGDSPNDLPLLLNSDIKIVIPGIDGPNLNLLDQLKDLEYILASEPNGFGWKNEINKLINKREIS